MTSEEREVRRLAAPKWRTSDDFDPPLATSADVYRRRIVVEATDDQTVCCVLEDDFHHFAVELRHDGRRVVDFVASSHRFPWATCPGAAAQLGGLVGADLSVRFTHAARATDARDNCTHQFDAAAHAMTAAAASRRFRQYDCEIGALLAVAPAAGTNRLWVDGRLVHQWTAVAGRQPSDLPEVLAPAPWKGGFMRWVDEHLEPEPAESAIALRRACDIGMGRGMPLDAIPVASDLLVTMAGVCHTMQPAVASAGIRNVGSIRDFAADPVALAGPAEAARVAIVRN